MKYLFIFIIVICCPFLLFSQIINTIAGNGTLGHGGNGGLASTAEIENPLNMTFDAFGNLFICEENFVRKISISTNIITIVAGSDTANLTGSCGNGGLATCAYLDWAQGICIDRDNNIYISDFDLNEVRRVDYISKIIDTFVGMRIAGYNGDSSIAKHTKLNGPRSIAIDNSRMYLYIADDFNYRVRRVDLVTNMVTTIAGNGIMGYSGDGGLATDAHLNGIEGLCIDTLGNIYVGESLNHRIRKISIETNMISTIAGNGTVGYTGDGFSATNANINRPFSMTVDNNNNLYFADMLCNVVRKVDNITGIISTIAGNGTLGFSGDGDLAIHAQFYYPCGIAIDSCGNIYISDEYNQRIRKVTYDTSCTSRGGLYTNSLKQEDATQIYPNPANNYLNINAGYIINTLSITNIIGQTMLNKACKTEKVELDIGNLKNGVYFVKVNEKWVGRFLKQ